MTMQGKFDILHGNCLDSMKELDADSIDSIVTDPPYGLEFMGKEWDHGVPATQFWVEALRVAKPGAYLLAFGGTRTYHRLACAIEDAGWEIRDCVMWVYGSGFPKSMDVSKAITARQWQGWGTALKPAYEPIIVARKPLCGTVAENVLKHGTGAINIDGCRVETKDTYSYPNGAGGNGFHGGVGSDPDGTRTDTHEMHSGGRFPANLIHDGSDEVLELFPYSKSCDSPSDVGCESKFRPNQGKYQKQGKIYPGEEGSAARFFYCAKASKSDRGEGNIHPTVKPTALMRYLCKLVTQPNGVVLDPFMGSGSTGKAAMLEGFRFIGMELNEEYIKIARARIEAALNKTDGGTSLMDIME